MTLPRRVLPGAAIMVSRRCTQRQFLLRPDPVVEQVLTFCLGLAAKRWNVEVFCFVALSNHLLCAAAHSTWFRISARLRDRDADFLRGVEHLIRALESAQR